MKGCKNEDPVKQSCIIGSVWVVRISQWLWKFWIKTAIPIPNLRIETKQKHKIAGAKVPVVAFQFQL